MNPIFADIESLEKPKVFHYFFPRVRTRPNIRDFEIAGISTLEGVKEQKCNNVMSSAGNVFEIQLESEHNLKMR